MEARYRGVMALCPHWTTTVGLARLAASLGAGKTSAVVNERPISFHVISLISDYRNLFSVRIFQRIPDYISSAVPDVRFRVCPGEVKRIQSSCISEPRCVMVKARHRHKRPRVVLSNRSMPPGKLRRLIGRHWPKPRDARKGQYET